MELPKLFTPVDVAKAMKQTAHYVEKQARHGGWPHHRVARGAIRFTAEDYAEVLRLCASKGATPQSGLTELSQVRRRHAAARGAQS